MTSQCSTIPPTSRINYRHIQYSFPPTRRGLCTLHIAVPTFLFFTLKMREDEYIRPRMCNMHIDKGEWACCMFLMCVLRIACTIGMEEGKTQESKEFQTVKNLNKPRVKSFNTLPSVEASSIRTHCSTIYVHHASAPSVAFVMACLSIRPRTLLLLFFGLLTQTIAVSHVGSSLLHCELCRLVVVVVVVDIVVHLLLTEFWERSLSEETRVVVRAAAVCVIRFIHSAKRSLMAL